MYTDKMTGVADGISLSGAGGSLETGKIILLTVLAIFLMGTGCGASEKTWSTESQSPDGRWLAMAQTVQAGGFGTSTTTTDVSLKWTKGSDRPETILVFVHDPSSVPDSIHLSMNWVAPSHLEVTFDGHPRINFQVVKYGDVEISLRDLSSVPAARHGSAALP
jgi:hypothetical protein